MRIPLLHHLHLSRIAYLGGYLVQHMATRWKSRGHQVIYCNNVQKPFPEADIIFLHIDLTCVPDDYLQALPGNTFVINRYITDISKSVFSEISLKAGDHYPHPVIVKTQFNYGGLPEHRNLPCSRFLLRHHTEPVDWENIRCLPEYRIFPSSDEVPQGIWNNDRLIVEKFLPEHQGNGQFRLREWIFFGDREIHTLKVSSSPIVKGRTTISRSTLPISDVPEKLRTIRRKLRIDYAKFDYNLYDGEVILYDINKTVGAPLRVIAFNREINKHIKHLSDGLYSFRNGVCP